MTNYEEKIDKIRSYFDEHKAECYPIVNTILAEKEEYTKSLYFRILCMLIRYTNEPNEMQILYIKRLIAGTQAENTFQDYIKMAIEIETKDIEEFISIFSKDELKYYFCIDGALLLNVTSNDKDYKLLAEIIEMLGITKEELNYLMAITRSICLQDSEALDNAKNLSTDSTKSIDIYPYIKGFYSGDIVNTPTLLHITSYNESELDLSQYGEISAQKVIIENIQYNILESLIFDGCAEIIIRSCKFIGQLSSLVFRRVGKIIIENCEFSNFETRVGYFSNVNEIECRNNKFISCGCTSSSEYESLKGGVFYIQGNKTNSIVLKTNNLINCYVSRSINKYNYGCTGIFMQSESYATISVIDNCFNGCQCINNGSSSGYTDSYISGSFQSKEESNNICTGSVSRIFEQD